MYKFINLLLEKQLSTWTSNGICKALNSDRLCGLGYQIETRQCVDGTREKCNTADNVKIIECKLPDCPRILGKWTNMGDCNSAGQLKTCGPGNQTQIRNCANGTLDKCSGIKTERTISCLEAGTSLPDCPQLGKSYFRKI